MDKKKILFIHQNLKTGGAEILRRDMLAHFPREKYDAEIVCIEEKGPIGETIEAMGFPVHLLGRSGKMWDFVTTWRLFRMMKRGQYDIVQTSQFYANFHGRLAARWAGVQRVFCEEHGFYHWKTRHRILIWIDRFLSRWTTAVVTCSESVRQFVIAQEKLPPHKVAAFPNGVDRRRLEVSYSKSELRARHRFSQKDFLIGVVATLRPVKGHFFLLQATPHLIRRFPAVKLLIIGEGSERPDLERRVREMRLSEQVQFLGERSDIPELLKCLDLFVLPSKEEGFGIALLEAMAVGIPVIATRTGGIPEIIDDGETGLLVRHGAVEDLVKAVGTLVEDPAKRNALSEKARAAVTERFTMERYMERFEGLYEGTLEDWDEYWRSRSLKKRIIELCRRFYFAPMFSRCVRSIVQTNAHRLWLLEAGCGSGEISRHLSSGDSVSVGCDLSLEAVRLARRNCRYVVVADIHHLPFKERAFDLVFNQGVMEHFSEPQFCTILKEFKRVARGTYVLVPGNTSLFRLVNPFGELDGQFFSKRQLADWMRNVFPEVDTRIVWPSFFLTVAGYGKDGDPKVL